MPSFTSLLQKFHANLKESLKLTKATSTLYQTEYTVCHKILILAS